MIRRTTLLVGMALLPSVACVSQVSFECADDAPLCEILDVTGDQRRRAPGIEITRVAWAQGVHTDLMADGQAAVPVVPLVAGRDAVIRVFVEPAASFNVRDITARFTLSVDGDVVGAAQGTARPNSASTMDSLDSTINVRVPGKMIPAGEVEWAVELLEAPNADRRSGSTKSAVFPADGGLPIEIQDGGVSLRIHLIPVEWQADGSGRVPSTGPDAIEAFRVELHKIFPAAQVEIEVGPPMPWDSNVDSSGNGWSPLLQAVGELRNERTNIAPDQYIYGLFKPWEEGRAGVAGLSNLAGSPRDAQGRASIGVSFAAGAGAGTMAHEVGHAHGLSHAPCGGAAGADPAFPHEGAGLGSYGYDLYEDVLKGPNSFVDLMSYCNPVWVSDYYYAKMFDRQKGIYEVILGGADGDPSARTLDPIWQTVWVHQGGEVVMGAERRLPTAPVGDPVEVELDSGERVEGVFVPFDHVDGGVIFVPAADPVVTVSVDGGPEMTPMPTWPTD